MGRGASAPEGTMGKLIHRTGLACTYFVTTKTWQNRPLFKVEKVAEIIANRLFKYRERETYLLHEFVIMADHLHLLLTPGIAASLERATMLIRVEVPMRSIACGAIEWKSGRLDFMIRPSGTRLIIMPRESTSG